jgi:hypothetical protein
VIWIGELLLAPITIRPPPFIPVESYTSTKQAAPVGAVYVNTACVAVAPEIRTLSTAAQRGDTSRSRQSFLMFLVPV